MPHYLRPIALVHGPDAKALIVRGRAAPLAGRLDLGFMAAEWISRDAGVVSRQWVGLEQAKSHPAFGPLTALRPACGPVALDHVQVMGIINATPDSFSDGGLNFAPETALAQARQMLEDGAEIIDVGGESTRPGSDAVAAETERARVLPIIRELTKDCCVSVDTRKAEIMAEAAAAGAQIINDVSALRHDPAARRVAAGLGLPVVLMHAQGDPKTMQLAPKYDDVVLDVYDELANLIAAAEAAGIARTKILADPGIGFGKTFAQNLALLQHLSLFHGLGVGLLVGLSRKAFIGAITGEKMAARRASGSVGGAIAAAMQGAQVLRVHDVKETVSALQVFGASLNPSSARV